MMENEMSNYIEGKSPAHDHLQSWLYNKLIIDLDFINKHFIDGGKYTDEQHLSILRTVDKYYSIPSPIILEQPVMGGYNYERVIGYIDIFMARHNGFAGWVIECKPEIESMGSLIRQMKFYKSSFRLYGRGAVVSSFLDDQSKILLEQGIRPIDFKDIGYERPENLSTIPIKETFTPPKDQYKTVSGIVLRQTEKAILLSLDERSIWVPKSQINIKDNSIIEGEEVALEVKQWFAQKENL